VTARVKFRSAPIAALYGPNIVPSIGGCSQMIVEPKRPRDALRNCAAIPRRRFNKKFAALAASGRNRRAASRVMSRQHFPGQKVQLGKYASAKLSAIKAAATEAS
jgi:hypothetical protein